MEAVRAFNNELSSLYEVRPPVSRAKMTHITKCAIKAIKFYKHVVQSVEKFVLKCKPDYKVPGLYVVDSIVRQSRHQFGAEKDVYAPRFTKNIVTTFQNLLKCPPDEKSKIVRVLNLWQKNSVFPIEVIQPLMDLAGDPLNADLIAAAQRAVDRIVPSAKPGQQKGQSHTPVKQADPLKAKPEPVMNSQASADSILTTQTDMLNTVNQLLQQTQQPQSLDEQQQQLQQLQILQQQLLEQTQMMQQPEDQGPVIDNTLLAQIQTLTNQLLTRTTDHKPPEPAFNKNLLDFDYGESDEEDKEGGTNNNNAGPVQHLLTDQTLMTQIKQMSQTIQKTEQLNTEMSMQEQFRQRLQQQQEEFDQQINQGTMARGPIHIPPPGQPLMPQFPGMMDASHPPPDHPQTMESEDVMVVQDECDRRGRDRSRSPKRRRRSRSRSRDRRKRSRSRDRHRRSRSEEREKNRERERERWKKRLPPIKDKQVSVCSTTIFVGHLAKLTSEEELVRELENYGAVDSINMIPPRGCAFVCMNRRKDAAKAVEKMKGMKINGSAIKIAWAPGKGMKDLGFKDSWYVDLGVTYIPWDKLPTDLSVLVDGGIIDEDTLPDHLKELAAAMLRAETGAEDKQQGPPPVEPQSGPVGMPPGGPPPPGPQPIPQGQPPFHPPLPTGIPPGNSIRVLQPGPPVGMINPMLIPMPGQSLPPMPGAQVGMHPVMALSQPRHPQGVRIPLMSIPNQPTTSAGSQLNVAIQNIMASSGGPTPVKDTRPHLVRPGFNSPRPGLFQVGFNPQQPSPHPPQGYNPNVPPPRVGHPNFRMPPPSFGGQAPLGDGDSTPEQDEGQATITKVISNDWPNKYSNRESENSFPGGGPPFGQPQENRMPLSHEQKLLQTPPMGNRLPLPRGLTPIFSQHNSPMNANSPRPLLGQRMMRPERPDTNGPQIRQLLGGPQGMAQPFGSGGHGRPPRPQGGMGEMDGPQPLMGNRFTGPRPPGPSLLGLRPGFPGSRMLAPLHRFQAEQAGGPRHNFPRPMDDRIRPLMDSPGRPFERPEFDRFGDRDRMRFPGPHGNRHDGRPPIPDRWGPLDGPPGIERDRDRERDRDMDRDRDNPRDRPPFDRFERNEFRRPHEDRRSHEEPPPDWRMNRRENRNHHSQEEEMGLPESGGRRWQEEPRDEPERGPERAGRDKDRARRSRWSNLDPSQVGDRPPLLNESTETMDDSVSMEDANSSMNELPDQSVQGDAQHLPKDVLGGAGPIKTDKPDGEGVPTESLTEGKGLPEIPLPVPNPVSAVVNSPVPTQEPSQDAATPMKVNPLSEGLPKSADSAPLERNVCMPPMGDVPQPENTAEPPVPSMTGGNHTQISVTPKAGLEVSSHVKPMQSDSEAAKSMDEGNGTENGSIFIANKDPALGKSVSDVTSQVEAKERSPMEEGELEPGEVSS